MIVDCHTHVWGRGFLSRAFYSKLASQWADREPGRTPEMIMPKLVNGTADDTGDGFVANMDRAGVDASFVMMVDSGRPLFDDEPEVSISEQVEWYGELQRRHTGRLFSNVFVDQRRPGCLDLVRRAVRELGFVGIGEVSPAGFRASDPGLRPLMRLAAELGVPVQIHTRAGVFTDHYGDDHTRDNPCHPAHVADLARELPDLKLVLCHAGFPHWWEVAAQAIADLPNCVLDLSNWEELVDRPQELVPRLAYWRDVVGSDRILFGSDQTSGERFTGERSRLGEWVRLLEDLPEQARSLGYRFQADEAAAILGANAMRFYTLG